MFCPICSGVSNPVLKIPFQKSCNSVKTNETFSRDIEYSKCNSCGFIFANTMYSWNEEFRDLVYNKNYFLVDPDHAHDRPFSNAEFLDSTFRNMNYRHLDFGGGNGVLSKLLKEKNWNSFSYDPFYDDVKIDGKFNFVTAFEVFEHAPNIKNTLLNILNLMETDCVLLFSTLLTDGINDIENWWYASPRNGHISLYSSKSLTCLSNAFNLNFVSLTKNLHLMYRKQPDWLSVKIDTSKMKIS